MPKLYGKNYSKTELLKRVGDISQIAGVRRCNLAEGNERGVEALDFRTGSGFNFTVLPGRGMDISFAEYKGIPLAWISPCGQVAAPYFEPEGLGWLRSFYGGLLVTCGMTYAGAPCEDEGKSLGLHGRVSNIPAKNVAFDGRWEGEDYVLWARGKVAETAVFGENILLTREITAKFGENRLFLHDSVENRGFSSQPLMYLYHVNIGFPAVDEGSELISPTRRATPRDDDAKVEAELYHRFLPPTPGFRERVYYHDMEPDSEGNVRTAIVNRSFDGGRGFGVYIRYLKKELPKFVEWKMNGEGTYVVGMEPSNCWVEGRRRERERGELEFLEPGRVREYHLEIGVLTSSAEIEEFEGKVKGK
ncbi:MAG: aldose 1-epimerase family protein [bacterium]